MTGTVYLLEYRSALSGVALILIPTVLLIGVAHIAAPVRSDSEKLSVYECGFEPYSEIIRRVEINFITLSISFMLFDVEIVLLTPWVVDPMSSGFLGWVSMSLFCGFLFAGYFCEYFAGMLRVAN